MFQLRRENESALNKAALQIPVLCYHSWTIDGPLYANNDHVALEHDLQTLARKGYQILPLTELVAVLRGESSVETLAGKKLVCITFDDGRDLDYLDYWSEEIGEIRSFHTLLDHSKTWIPQHSAGPRAVSFVIASAPARRILDVECGNSLKLWNDFWWKECAAKGILGIANHSWDHVHQCLDTVRQQDNKKGSFLEISTFADAEAQIADAQRYIDSKTNQRGLPFFCYPYGHVPVYLRDEYFPVHGDRVGIVAAFSTSGLAVNEHTYIWDIPRFVCGYHWKSSDEFETLLDAMGSRHDETE